MKTLLSLFISFIWLLNISVFAQTETSTTNKNNLTVVKVKTANGTVTVKLPQDIHAGDIISGTVIADLKKSTKKKKSKKEKKKEDKAFYNLQSSKLRICGIVTDVSDKKFHFKVPENNVSNTILLQLLDKEMTILSNEKIPINNTIRDFLTPLQTPGYLRSGYTQKIKGTFDGNLTNSTINLNGKALDILAESPETIIVNVPENISGIQELEIIENDTNFTKNVSVINLNLSVDKSSLSSGETTNLHLNVSGLENIETPITVYIDNYTEGSVTLQNGNHQKLVIKPDLIDSQGIYNNNLQITAIHPGGYSLGVEIEEPTLIEISNSNGKKIGDDRLASQYPDGKKIGDDRLASQYPDGKKIGDDRLASQYPDGKKIGDDRLASQYPDGKKIGDDRLANHETDTTNVMDKPFNNVEIDFSGEEKEKCSYVHYTDWEKTGKSKLKADKSKREAIKKTRRRCHKCGKSVEWTYYKIPYYRYEKQKREKFTCSLRAHDESIKHHGTSTTEEREVVIGSVIKYEIVRTHEYTDKKSGKKKEHSEHIKWRFVKK